MTPNVRAYVVMAGKYLLWGSWEDQGSGLGLRAGILQGEEHETLLDAQAQAQRLEDWWEAQNNGSRLTVRIEKGGKWVGR